MAADSARGGYLPGKAEWWEVKTLLAGRAGPAYLESLLNHGRTNQHFLMFFGCG
jgi:hypothetical protein